jgi:glucose-6-phosphate dehydrogenase assembly protein OpcA
MNPHRYGNMIFSQFFHPYFVVRNDKLQLYLQQLRDIDVQNRNTFILEDGLYIGRKGLGPIASKLNKVIICFLLVVYY